MNVTKLISAAFASVCSLALWAGSLAIADPPKDPKAPAKPAAAAEPKLPPGWTVEDLQAFAAAATPGEQHKQLAKEVGVWYGKNTMWMSPGAEPIQSESTTTVTSLYDGRFIKSEMKGEMPGMGPYNGLAIAGFDNITQKFVSTWIDNMSTGFAHGEGKLTKDGKTMTWTYDCNCPLTKKPINMRQVETTTGPGKKVQEMFGTDPKTGVEYKMMRIELTKAK
jgi:hypothetical protein